MQCEGVCPADFRAPQITSFFSPSLLLLSISVTLAFVTSIFVYYRLACNHKTKIVTSLEGTDDSFTAEQNHPICTSPQTLTSSLVPAQRTSSVQAFLQRSSAFISQNLLRSTTQDTLHDGHHIVEFPDGSSYSGQWAKGHMQGRGIFIWPSGDRYEGEWFDGKQHGQGTFLAADGSTYFGGWADGKMDGQGVFRPASPASTVYLRTYINGQMEKETSLRIDSKNMKRKKQLKDEKKRVSNAPPRPLHPGEVIYKGHHSYDLMRQLQVGIMYSIAQAGQRDIKVGLSQPDPLVPSDFSAESVQYFPAGSADEAPPFKWKDYAPRVFQHLRCLFGIDNADYLVSLTGGPALRELPSPGASGCIFFLSSDDRFLIKSVRKEEMVTLLDLVPRYHSHVAAFPGTFLVRFFGIHRISPFLGRNARFLVMGNVLPTDIRIHRKYDLKGSSYKRTVGEEKRNSNSNATLKDLDVDMKFELPPERRKMLLSQLSADAKFLESLHVIDYSLLLGVHFVNWGEGGWYPPFTEWPVSTTCHGSGKGKEEEEEEAEQEEEEHRREEKEGEKGAVAGQQQEQQQRPTPHRTSSMQAAQTLVDTLQSMSSAGMLEPSLSKVAASVVATADSSRMAARVMAKEADRAIRASLIPTLHMPALPPANTKLPCDDCGGKMMPKVEEDNSNTNMLQSTPETLGKERQKMPPRTTSKSNPLPGNTTSLKREVNDQRGNGWGISAVAVRRNSTGTVTREPVLLYFGIIDFLQHYNARKWMEHAWKVSIHGPSVSVADPHHYAKRFESFLGSLFVDAGDEV